MKPDSTQPPVARAVHQLGTEIIGLAARSWQRLHACTAVAQELAKDPFTQELKSQAATAEFLIILLHACDRIAAAAFQAALPAHAAPVVRNSLMAALVGATIPAFVRAACAEEDAEELADMQADLLHLYNTRATQYGFFPLGAAGGHEPLLTLAGIRLAEALECAENPEVITHGVETVVDSLTALRQELPLKDTLGQLIAGGQ
ncbi:MAG: hypothetical protein AB1671_25335 [Thermodesulfobacteriota bacterium]|jgi:hypothetical protein